MSVLTLHGCDDELARILKETSDRRGLSVNRPILETLRDALIGRGKKPMHYGDLDALAGSWSVAEAAEFDKNMKTFEVFDDELWKA
jgi:hypothetical protein